MLRDQFVTLHLAADEIFSSVSFIHFTRVKKTTQLKMYKKMAVECFFLLLNILLNEFMTVIINSYSTPNCFTNIKNLV